MTHNFSQFLFNSFSKSFAFIPSIIIITLMILLNGLLRYETSKYLTSNQINVKIVFHSTFPKLSLYRVSYTSIN